MTRDSKPRLDLLILLGGLLLGGMAAAWLRKGGVEAGPLPWIILLVAVILGARSLYAIREWLPGGVEKTTIARSPTVERRGLGRLALIAAAVLGVLVVAILVYSPGGWTLALPLWLLAIALGLTGAALLGGIGAGSSRAATTVKLWQVTRVSRVLEIVAFLLILALAIILRTYRLDSIPPGLYVNETDGGMDALRIMAGNRASVFGTGWYEVPNAFMYYMALVFKLFGANWFGLKMVSLIPALLTMPAAYALARTLFGPLTALLAMFFMAISRWHLSMSRWGWSELAPPLLQMLTFLFLIRGLQRRRALDYALSGLIAGLSIYTYLSARLAVLTLMAYALYWILSDPAGLKEAIRRHGQGMMILGLTALIAVAPIAVTYVASPFTFSHRMDELSVLRQVRESSSLAPLLGNLLDSLKFFHQVGDRRGLHNLPGLAMLDPVTGVLFALGLAYGLMDWRDHRRILLLLWLLIGMAGSYLSSHSDSPNAYRSLTALPAVALLAADMLDRILRAVYAVMGGRKTRRSRTSWAPVVAASLALLIGGTAGVWEAATFFGPQAHSLQVLRSFNPAENGVARDADLALRAGRALFVSPRISSYSPLRFVADGLVLDNLLPPAPKPLRIFAAEATLPLPVAEQDALLLLDNEYGVVIWLIQTVYPDSRSEQVSLPDGTPLYWRIQIPRDQLESANGLTQIMTLPDGSKQVSLVAQLDGTHENVQAELLTWEGSISIDHGGIYEFESQGGREVFLDGEEVRGPQYRGRGIYDLQIHTDGTGRSELPLRWRIDDGEFTRVPEATLFHLIRPRYGFLGTYWRNANWESEPLFHQLIPLAMLYWPDEPPILPGGAFSARLSGALDIEVAGQYRFRVNADDGARLILDGVVVGEGLVSGRSNSFEAVVDLDAGKHDLRLDYFQAGGGSTLELLWKQGDGPWLAIAPQRLSPAAQ